MRLAVIPARANSKGLQDKNVYPILNKPLIAYTIEAAIESKLFDIIAVTTDSEKVISITQQYEDIEILIRHPKLATDEVPLAPVIVNAVNHIEARLFTTFKTVYTLQPTSPLRDSLDIIKAHAIYERYKFDSLISVKECRHSIWRRDRSYIKRVMEPADTRQETIPYYIGNGAIFISNARKLKTLKSRLFGKIGLYVMDDINSLDVHTIDDINLCEYYLNRRKSE